jgi:hypothetical protein
MVDPKSANSKAALTVAIVVALIGCLGVIIAALINILPQLLEGGATPQPTIDIVSTRPPTDVPQTLEPSNPEPGSAPDVATAPTVPDTPPGTILEVGQTWRQGGIELRLDKGEVMIGDEYREHGPGVLIGFSLTNRKPQQITFQITQEDFFASDNRGRQLQVGKVNPFYGYYFAPPMDDIPINLQSGEHIELYYDYDAFFVRDDITDPSVTEIIIGATGISGIDNARWRIPIFH